MSAGQITAFQIASPAPNRFFTCRLCQTDDRSSVARRATARWPVTVVNGLTCSRRVAISESSDQSILPDGAYWVSGIRLPKMGTTKSSLPSAAVVLTSTRSVPIRAHCVAGYRRS